jgi:hypothetical protein
MSKSNSLETSFLNHIFKNLAIANVGDATGLPAAATVGSLYIGLHTADPGEAGSQTTNEAAYTSYARVAVARSGAGWTVSGNTCTNAGVINFPLCTGGTETETFFSIGTASSGTGTLLFSGPLAASLAVSNGITPSFAIGAVTITED